jgi:hypothetical protein
MEDGKGGAAGEQTGHRGEGRRRMAKSWMAKSSEWKALGGWTLALGWFGEKEMILCDWMGVDLVSL